MGALAWRTSTPPQTARSARSNNLVEDYGYLIYEIAREFAARLPVEVELEDLVCAGVVGLIDAGWHHRPGDLDFNAAAGLHIRRAILGELLTLDWVPRDAHRLYADFARVTGRLTRQFGRTPRDEEVARALGIELSDWRRRLSRLVSLMSFFPDITHVYDDVADAAVLAVPPERRARVLRVIAEMPARERTVLMMRVFERLEPLDIARRLEADPVRIASVLETALGILRPHLTPAAGHSTLLREGAA